MLPEKLSTDLTSLNYESDRLAIVIEMVIGEDGMLQASDIYTAMVRNRAKLAYNGVASWLEGSGQCRTLSVRSTVSTKTSGFRTAWRKN